MPEVITGPPSSWGMLIRGPRPPDLTNRQSETVEYSYESREIRVRELLQL
jgi:hypothetical protein